MHFPNRRIACLLMLALAAACTPPTGPQLLTASGTQTAAESPWFEPKLSAIASARVMLDLSALNRTPAGESGFVSAHEGHFYDGSGRRVRFFGVNLSGDACFPSSAEAATLARSFRRLGLNAVRLQGLDLRSPELDAAAFDRLDRLVAELKAQGIYVVIVLKTFGYAALPSELERNYPGGRILDRFSPELVAELATRAQRFVQHENPYTHQRYSSEPGVLAFELSAEDTLFPSWAGSAQGLPDRYRAELEQALAGAREREPQAAEMRLLAQVELATARYLITLLRDNEHVRSLIVNTQASFGGQLGLVREASVSDYVDLHGFWDHPVATESASSPAFSFENTSQLAFAEHGTLARLAAYRLVDKPLVVSEYAASGANDFAVEGLPLLAAIASFQDWDALFPYAFRDKTPGPSEPFGFFDMAGHPTKLAFLPFAALLFRRSLITPGSTLLELALGRDASPAAVDENALPALWSKAGVPSSGFAVTRLGVRLLDGDAPARASHLLSITPPLTSETHELIWDAESREPTLIVNAPSVKLLLGFGVSKRLDLGGVELEVQKTSNGFAALGVIALDEQPIASSRQVLVVAANRAENSDMRWARDRRALESWGNAPVRAERVRGVVLLPGAGYRASALELDGTFAGPITVRSVGANSELDLSDGAASLCYLLER